MNVIIVCLIGMIFVITIWFSIPYMKLNHLIVWLNRNRRINHCDWISDSFQSLLCVAKSKEYSVDNFASINIKCKLSFDSPFRICIFIALAVKNHCSQDGKILDEINDNFVVYFIYKNFKWIVISVERNLVAIENN